VQVLRGRLNGAAMGLAGITALVIGLAAIDDRVGTELARLIEGRGPSDEIIRISAQIEHAVLALAQSVSYHSIEQAPLTIFALAALVLVLFMLRT
jgi:hypothetical protein